MATSKKETVKSSSLTIRLCEADKEYIGSRGHGNLSEGFDAILSRYRELCRAFSPAGKFTADELTAIVAANKSFAWQLRLKNLSDDLALNIEDYPVYEPQEAGQWSVDYKVLAERVRQLHPLEAVAIMDAADVFFERQIPIEKLIPVR